MPGKRLVDTRSHASQSVVAADEHSARETIEWIGLLGLRGMRALRGGIERARQLLDHL